MFMQADRRIKGAQGGMGIGLTLVKSLVEMHGGQVSAQSAGLGKGSEFIVSLPLIPVEPDAARGSGGLSPTTDSSARNVLVVDDNVDAAQSLAMLLRVTGHQTQVAHDGQTALRLAEADPPEIAFLDIGMPEMDGYELARRFRDHPKLANVLLVALTGWGQEEDRRRTSQAGFDAHEVKPVTVEAIQKLLARRR
jgi:CheY-like chemotaxis protein